MVQTMFKSHCMHLSAAVFQCLCAQVSLENKFVNNSKYGGNICIVLVSEMKSIHPLNECY